MAEETDIQAVIEALPGPIIALDLQLTVLCFNAAARTVAPALRTGDPLSLALRIPEVLEAARRAGATGRAQNVEFSERVPIDRWYAADVTPAAVQFGAHRGGILLLSLRDLTPLRRVEQMRADFVANASHELRTPLAALSGFIETMQGPGRDDPAARERFLSIMQAQATRMARLIDDLLSLSRIELNAHLRPDTPVDLLSVVRQVTDGLETLARDRDVILAVSAPEQPISVLGERDELIRAFENLIENALKYGVCPGLNSAAGCGRIPKASGCRSSC
jgi:two-component system phosphate regulon sensor histidine kinase PhoR